MDAKRAFRKGYNMLQNKTIVVAGGDLRQAQLARLLREHNRVYTIGLEKAEGLEDTFAETAALKQEPEIGRASCRERV